jgi:hypothetical protein
VNKISTDISPKKVKLLTLIFDSTDHVNSSSTCLSRDCSSVYSRRKPVLASITHLGNGTSSSSDADCSVV